MEEVEHNNSSVQKIELCRKKEASQRLHIQGYPHTLEGKVIILETRRRMKKNPGRGTSAVRAAKKGKKRWRIFITHYRGIIDRERERWLEGKEGVKELEKETGEKEEGKFATVTPW